MIFPGESFLLVYLVKLPFKFVDDGDTTWNELEAVFKYLLLTRSSDISVFTIATVNPLNYSVVDISKSPYLLHILKNPLKPKQPTTSPAPLRKVAILG